MIVNSRRTRGCATSQTTLLVVALLAFMGAGALWSVSGKASPQHKAPIRPIPVKAPASKPASQVPAVASLRDTQVAPATVRARSLVSRGKLPLAFEPNQGQAAAQVSYMARGSGYGLFLTPREAILALGGRPNAGSGKDSPSAAVIMQLEGASPDLKIAAAEPLPGKTNYLRGNDPSRWLRNVPTFARVRYTSVYPGIDLVYYGKQGQLEYDFAVRAGADPSLIHLGLSGVEGVAVSADGGLQMKTQGREIRWNKPVVYQEVNGERRNVAGSFQLIAENRVGFALGRYDHSSDLIIDPILAYATYFGGTGAELNPQVAVDANSNIYISGTTSSSTGFPACVSNTTTTCPLTPPAPTLEGPTDAFISKLDPVGASVLYTTYLNGLSLTPPVAFGNATGTDSGAGLAVDNQGNAYITGTTTSTDFPVTTNAFQSTPKTNGVAHVFISKLDSTGANLLYSSYLSGNSTDNALAVAADNTGHAYLLGWTQSVATGDFPTGTSFQQSAFNATRLYFVSKFDTTQAVGNQTLVFFSYLGGGTNTTTDPATPADGVICAQLPCGGIALDSTGNAYVAVGTSFTNLPAANAYQSTNHGGASDAYLAKITPDGASLLYASYLGGSGDDVANAIALDSSGNPYVVGSTTSADFPVSATTNVPEGAHGGQDAFLAKFNSPTTGAITLTYSSVAGGTGTDIAYAVAVDSASNAFIAGSTNSSDFPTPSGTAAASGTDAFLLKFSTGSAAISSFISSQLLGGSGTDRATSLALNPNGGAVMVGETNSANFPVQSQIFGVTPLQTALSGPSDAFLADFGPTTDLSLSITASPSPVAAGNAATFTYAVKNLGPDSSTGAVVTIPVPVSSAVGATIGAFSTTSGSCAATGTTNSQVETCTMGTIAANFSATITVPLTPTLVAPANKIPASIAMSGHVAAGNTALDPNPGNNSPSASDNVDYFTSAVTPPSFSVVAGKTATYTVTLTPHSPSSPIQFPASISLGCVLPTTPVAIAGATCTFTPTPIPTIPSSSGSATSVLKITTTAPTTTGEVHGAPRFWYALWLPLCGFAILGAGSTRRRRWITGAALVLLLGSIAMLPACGKSTPATTGGTIPGVYSIGITSTSGSYVYPPATSPLTVSLIVTAN